MIGVIVVAHGNLAQEFSHVVQKIMGPQENLHTLSIDGEELFPQATQTLKDLACQCDTGDGVLILTDLFGGTPSNLALSVLGLANIEVLAGVNMPMLIKALSLRNDTPLNKLVHLAQDAGKKYIQIANDVLQTP